MPILAVDVVVNLRTQASDVELERSRYQGEDMRVYIFIDQCHAQQGSQERRGVRGKPMRSLLQETRKYK